MSLPPLRIQIRWAVMRQLDRFAEWILTFTRRPECPFCHEYADGTVETQVTLYHGDALKLLPELAQQPDTCIVDPVWPNSVFPGIADPQQLFSDACQLLTVDRLVVHLGASAREAEHKAYSNAETGK